MPRVFFIFVILLGSIPSLGQTAQLPQIWVNNTEYTSTPTSTIAFPSGWSCHGTNYGPYTANNQASAQQSITDAETCRTAHLTDGFLIVYPAGSLFSGSPGLVLPQTAGDTSTSFITLTSSTPLTIGQTACSHGTAAQDNIASATQPALRNLGCTGASLSYQLGSTVTTISAGPFTLANGANTNTAAYADLNSMWTVESTNGANSPIITAAPDINGLAPHHYAILNAEVRFQAGTSLVVSLVTIGSGTETATSQLPSHIHIAYSYLHGDWTDAPVSGGVATGPATGANGIPNDVAFLGCQQCSSTWSYYDRSLRPGSEGHGIQMTNAQQIKLVHNWVEGNSMGTLCWGGTAMTIPGFVPCTDVEDRANRYTYPFSWSLSYAGGYKPNGGVNSWVRKNTHESKAAERYLMDGNILEQSDGSGGQGGEQFSFKNTNSSGASFGSNYWMISENVTVSNNITRHSCVGSAWGFRGGISLGNGGGSSLSTQKASYLNNLMYDADIASHTWCAGISPLTGFRIADNFFDQWAGSASRNSAGTITTLTLTSQPGGTQSNMNIGDPVTVFGCTGDTSFNTMTVPATSTAVGPLAISPTSPTSLTVVYANAGTPNSTDSTCTFTNMQGWPNALTHAHNTDILAFVTNTGDPDSSASGGNAPFSLARNMAFTNDIFIGGALVSVFGEGTRTQTKVLDSSTETFNNSIITARSGASCPGHTGAACYTEYGGPNAGASPPVTIYLAPTGNCTGSDPTAGSCVGIFGAMSTGTLNINLSDWTQYRLCHASDSTCSNKASLYAAGQTNQASDGTDLGFNPTATLAAQTSTLYACGSSCGTGPYPDIPASGQAAVGSGSGPGVFQIGSGSGSSTFVISFTP